MARAKKQKKAKSKIELYGELLDANIEKIAEDVFCQLGKESLFDVTKARQVLRIVRISLERTRGLCDGDVKRAASKILRRLKDIPLSSAMHALNRAERTLEKRRWGNYDAGFAFLVGRAFNSELNAIISIAVVAEGNDMALKLYDECIERHPELKAVPDPEILPLINSDEFFNDLAIEDSAEELAQFGSTPL